MKNIIVGLVATAGFSLIAATAIAGEGRGGKGFDRMDANGDGEISTEEIEARDDARKAHRAQMMAEADANGDGSVSREEFDAFREAKRAERNPDKNGDGVVDRAEFVAKAEERFDKLDKNGDGVLSEDEQHRGRGHGRHGQR